MILGMAAEVITTQKTPAVPGVRDVMEGATWLSQQTLAVWFAILTIMFGSLIYLVIRHLLKTIDSQREAHALSIKEQRDEFHKLQIEEKGLSLSLLQYLEKDHAQTVVLVKENQSIMQETVQLLRAIQADRHDQKLLSNPKEISK